MNKKLSTRIIYGLAGVFSLTFVLGILYVAEKSHKEQEIIKAGCIKTELYVLGGRNRSVNPVYDCTGADLKQRKR